MQGSPVTPVFPEWAKFVVLPVLGAFVKHLWDRYRGRLAPLRWTVTYQAMAFATEDEGWGKVELLYNGSPAQNLHMAYVQVQNASSVDLADLRVDLTADDKTIVLRSAGMIRDGAVPFRFADDYSKAIQQSVDNTIPDQDRAFWVRRSPFIVPVLNRGTVADFKLLVARFDYSTPTISVTVEHPGVRLLHQSPAVETWGVRQGQATLVGVIVGIATSYGALRYGMDTGWVVAIAWTVGAIAQLIGAAVIRAWRAFTALVG